jgi:hypothetical protein
VLGEIFGCWAYKAALTRGRRELHNNGVHIELSLTHVIESRNNSVGIATCYGPNGPMFEFTKGNTFVSSPKAVQTGTGTQTSYSSVTEGKTTGL